MHEDYKYREGLTLVDPRTISQLDYIISRCEPAEVSVVTDYQPHSDYTPHYAKKNKRSKFKRKGSE